MRQNSRHWNRGTWTRRTSPGEEADSSLLWKSPPMRNVVKDDSDTWAETVRAEDSVTQWNVEEYDDSFFEDNRKIFQWDDSGAVEYLKKVEVKLRQGINSVYADYVNDSNHFAASIDWNVRWLCALPDCAEGLEYRDDTRKNLKGSSARRDQFDGSSAVIFGLPEPKDDTGCSGTPSLHLPLDFVPVPTGWDDAEDIPRNAQREDLYVEHLKETLVQETQLKPTSQDWWQTGTNSNVVSMPGSGLPEWPNSYQHIIPSGWEDVQADQPIIPSGWGAAVQEPRSDTQMQQADIGWCDYPSDSSRPTWGNSYPSAESHPINGKSQSAKQQDLYNKAHKYGGWRAKRGSETSAFESSGRRNTQRAGKPISTIRRVNYDPRSPRINRAERSKAE